LRARLLEFPSGEFINDRWSQIREGRERPSPQLLKKDSKDEEEEESTVEEMNEALYGHISAKLSEIQESIPLLHRIVCAESEIVTAEEEENILEHITELYETHPQEEVLALAKRERIERKLFSEVYGFSEVNPAFFMSVLAKLRRIHGHLRLPNKGVFVECGSGLGKNVYIAALMHSWQRCVGIEKIAALNRRAQSLRERFNSTTMTKLPQSERDLRQEMGLAFINNDFFDGVQDLVLEATLLYADLTCFTPNQVNKFFFLTKDLVPGAVIVVLTRPLLSDYTTASSENEQHLFLLWSQDNDVLTSWGRTSAYIYERR